MNDTRNTDDILAATNAREVLTGMHTETAPGWDAPLPLAAAGAALPTFPAGLLPGWVADMVSAVATETQTPPDLAGCVGLAALSTAAGGRAVVNVRGAWVEPVNIFTVVAMPPASRKSPVFRAMAGPLTAAEQLLSERVEPEIAAATIARRRATENAEKAARTAVGATGETAADALAEATDAQVAADNIHIPPKPQLFADDITPERAASILAEQGGRLAVLSAEGGIFATLAGRYSGTPNLDLFLKGHAGDTLRVDRGTRAERVDRPALTLGLAVQPDVIAEIASMPGFRGKGLLGRILYALPSSNIGYREVEPPPFPAHVEETYTAHLAELVTTMHGWEDPVRLFLTDAARSVFTDHRRETEKRLRPDSGDLAHVADWAGKYDGAVVRLAGLIHLAADVTDGWRQPIDADTITRAITLGGFFAEHALAAFGTMTADPARSGAARILDWLRRAQPPQFTRRDAHRALQRAFPRADDLEPALAMLEDHGWIRTDPDTARRKTPTYYAHPDISSAETQPPSTHPAR